MSGDRGTLYRKPENLLSVTFLHRIQSLNYMYYSECNGWHKVEVNWSYQSHKTLVSAELQAELEHWQTLSMFHWMWMF